MTTGKLRVLIVDDSLFMRAAIKKILAKERGFEVAGMAKDGQEAVEKIDELAPDVVTMDFNMPRMDGAQAVREIMRKRPTPVIMFSAHTRQGARETFGALAAGAVDFVTKPAGEVSANLENIAEELVTKLRAAASARLRSPSGVTPAPVAEPAAKFVRMATMPPGGFRVLFVAVSTGGPAALSRVIPALPATLRCGLVVVQHMPADFTTALAERLDQQSSVRVREAIDGDVPEPGLVLIAPGSRHLRVAEGGVLRLDDGPLVHGCRPAADVTMRSAAAIFGRRAAGLVMTGMGRDGTDGLAAIKAADGRTLAQEQETCVIPGMPRSAIAAGVVDDVIPLDALAAQIQSL